MPQYSYAAGTVWVEDGMRKILKDDLPKNSSEIVLYTAGNEYEPFQVVVSASNATGLSNVQVTVSDLIGPGGATIPSSSLTLYKEHYVQVTQGSERLSNETNVPLGPGWYPDGLIPFANPTTGQDLAGTLNAVPFDVPAGENQPVWVDIYTPSGTPPGIYSGTVMVTSDQGATTKHILLTVWDFSLPTKPSLSALTRLDPSRSDKTNAIELLKHRFNPGWVDKTDERELIDRYGLSIVKMPFWSGADYHTCSISSAPSVGQVQTAAAGHQPGLTLVSYYADEIWPCPQIFPQVREWASNLRSGGTKPLLVMYPIDDLMGTSLNDTAADIWVVLPEHYDQALTNITKLINHSSTEVWSYNPLIQDPYSPKLTVDFSPVNSRIMHGFINQSLDMTGTLIWQVDYWGTHPWNNVENYRSSAPGEGHMVYPGDDVGLPGAIVSGMRMKWFREGSEDYEYIQILKRMGMGDFAHTAAFSIAADFHTWRNDADALMAVRKSLGDAISARSTPIPSSTPSGGCGISGDIDCNNTVNIFDLSLLLSVFGQSATTRQDINGDGTVTIFDLSLLLSNFGK